MRGVLLLMALTVAFCRLRAVVSVRHMRHMVGPSNGGLILGIRGGDTTSAPYYSTGAGVGSYSGPASPSRLFSSSKTQGLGNIQEGGGATLIDGKSIAAEIRGELKRDIDDLKRVSSVAPGLAVILVGDRKDSATYVRSKKRACAEVGIESTGVNFPVSVTEDELVEAITTLNSNSSVHGILVQLPLPPHIDEARVLACVAPSKDVDGLHPANVHKLATTKTHSPGRSSFSFDAVDFHVTCTPQGCIELLDRSGVDIAGTRAVVIGRSNIVGVPLALLLMQRDATVTIAHSRTRDIAAICQDADIVVAAVGRPGFVQPEWLKPGATVIDVGINAVDAPGTKKGYRLMGDVDPSCAFVAGRLTPVPGGVGPMTIAMLLRNTYLGARRSALGKR